MKKQKSVKLNILMNSILSMSGFLFPLITWPYISRLLGPGKTGSIAFATSVVSYFALFAQMGIPTYGIRAVAIVRDDVKKLSHTVQELMILNLGLLVVVYSLFLLSLVIVPQFRQEKPLFLVTSMTMVFNMLGANWMYQGLEQYTYITVRSIIFKMIAVVLMFALIHSSDDYVIYGAIAVFAAVGSGALNFINLHKHISFKKSERYNFKRHFRSIGLFFAMTAATTIYTNLDTIMIRFICNEEETGYYNAAVKIKNILVSLITSLGAVLLPRLSYYLKNNMKEEFYRITAKAFRFVVLVSIPMTVYFVLFAKPGILFVSGEEYLNAISPMQIIMPTIIFIGMTNITGIQMLIPMGKEKYVLYSEIAGAIVDLIINALAIPKYGASGAAIGTLVAEFVVLLVQGNYLKADIRHIISQIQIKKELIALFVSTTLIVILMNQISLDNCFLQLLWSALVFFGSYGVMLLLLKEPFVMEVVEDTINKLKKKKLNQENDD